MANFVVGFTKLRNNDNDFENFEKTKSSAMGADTVSNIGGNFYKKTFGDPKQRKILYPHKKKSPLSD